MINPYQPPIVTTETLPNEHPARFSVWFRIIVGVSVSLIPLWIFETNPELISRDPVIALFVMTFFAWLLGMMPSGYGRHDAAIGLWVLLLTVFMTIWGALAGPTFQPGFPSAMPASTALIVVGVYAAIIGAVCTTIYAVTRLVSKRVSQTRTVHRDDS